jgi:DNA-binding MarR family transcriptional regulator
MNTELLVNLGLTRPQAAVYLALIEHGQTTAPEIAGFTGQTRTNAYTLLDKLTELGLAERVRGAKKITYRALGPSALEYLVTTQRQAAQKREQLLQANLPDLMTFFHTHSEQPTIRFFQGRDEIKKIYDDQIATGDEILIVRSPDDVASHRNPLSHKQHLLTTTYIAEGGYTAPVEWDIYGNKVSIISFGNEAIGMIIESPQIAESMRQMYTLLESGLHHQSNYHQLSKHRSGMHSEDTQHLPPPA